MEKRKETMSAIKMCRFCLTQNDPLFGLYERNEKPNHISRVLKIMSCLSIEVFPSDKMPTYICKRCSFFMDLFYDYKQICRRADERILQYIQKGAALETISWPVALTDVFRSAFKHVKKIGESVTESGTTVQVTTQDGSNSEEDEDEENFIKIKIDDPSGDGAKCIKLVASKNESDSKKDVSMPKKKGGKQFEDGCWACNECDRTYPLQQLLKLHKKQKHRARNVQCNECDAKFFTKYDLMTHSVRHSDEMPFQCIACARKFKRLVLLKRHEKVMHPDIPQLPCPHCPATFLSIEELEAHQKRHMRNSARSHVCSICDKRFFEKVTLQRHMELVHRRKADFNCEYCPGQFTSISTLTRHVRTHAGDRPYPCKYCEKSFTKSHHYTRHLRLKHSDIARDSRRAISENYRCEQCEESFTTQDDLLYHSAIHATQNLTCPLCQEKFPNVDAVTTHIKSHVNGMEFMCDMCELVFTSKQKLDNHMAMIHADEISQDIDQEESSMDVEDYDDDNAINVKEEDGEMVVEIKKRGFLLPEPIAECEEKSEVNQSEDSETEATYTELSTVDTLTIVRKDVPTAAVTKPLQKAVTDVDKQSANILKKAEQVKSKVQATPGDSTNSADKKEKVTSKADSGTVVTTGASDKSLRLLEKELQELKRTTTRNEATKTPSKPTEMLRNRRPQLYTSTPKPRLPEEKKISSIKQAIEKKVPERRVVTKENKEPKETKLNTITKEDKEKELKEKEARDAKEKEVKEKEIREREIRDKEIREKEIREKEIKEKEVKEREVKEKEVKEKEIKEKEVKEKEVRESKEKEVKLKDFVKEKESSKILLKNGNNDKSPSEETVRRSTRPSKIKDYAKMIRHKSQESSSDVSDEDDEESKEAENPEVSVQVRPKGRRVSVKPASKVLPPTPSGRKRGRPKKEQTKEVPSKIKKQDFDDDSEDESSVNKSYVKVSTKTKVNESNIENDEVERSTTKEADTSTKSTHNESRSIKCEISNVNQESHAHGTSTEKHMDTDNVNKPPSNDQKVPGASLLVSPSGQTLKKVPIKALPPGIKPLPLPANARSIGTTGELCEMQIGKKVVKVQKIVMTKAEVEAMAKKGLVEMKDGTMVLKQGIKIPTSESLKSTLIGDKDPKESLKKVQKSAVSN